MGRLLGYGRVSRDEQNVDLQTQGLREAGVSTDLLYIDEGLQGDDWARPALRRLLADVRAGDIVICWHTDRLARDVVLQGLIFREIRAAGAEIRSLTQALDLDLDSPEGRLMAQIQGAMAEYEKSRIKARVNAGISAYRKREGRWGRRRSLIPARVEHAHGLRADGKSMKQIAVVMGVSKSTVERALRGWQPNPGSGAEKYPSRNGN
jgi:DNA invertase Pin-like site-specific DNA recombinase